MHSPLLISNSATFIEKLLEVEPLCTSTDRIRQALGAIGRGVRSAAPVIRFRGPSPHPCEFTKSEDHTSSGDFADQNIKIAMLGLGLNHFVMPLALSALRFGDNKNDEGNFVYNPSGKTK